MVHLDKQQLRFELVLEVFAHWFAYLCDPVKSPKTEGIPKTILKTPIVQELCAYMNVRG